MTGLSNEQVASFRALSQPLRAELLRQIERAAKGLSPARLQRIVRILDRHVFRGEAPREVYRALQISRQQFYDDLREGTRRLSALVERKSDRSGAIAIEDPRQTVIAQAGAAYHAGMSQQALQMLQRLRSSPLGPSEAAEIAGLELEVREDLMMPLESLMGAAEVIDRARVHAELTQATAEDRALLEGAAHWMQTHFSCWGPDRERFLREYESMTSLLRPRAFAGDRNAALAFCRFSLTALLMLDSFGLHLDGRRAERALSDVDRLLHVRDDMPATMLATLHARHATFLSGKVAQAHRFREERALAYKLGIQRASTPSVWFALGMEVPQSLALGETSHALACASALYESVRASESVEWQPTARMMLAHAYNGLGRYAEALELIPARLAFARPYRADTILPACETLLGLQRYSECFDLATLLVDNFKGVHRMSALILRAQAAYHSGNAKSARADINEAVAMFDSERGHSFYAICSGYRVAYLITQEKRYLDILRAIETMLESDVPETPLVGEARGLTARQRVIARLASSGETNGAIAQQLSISPRTVKNAINAIYARLGVKARWQLADALRSNAESFVDSAATA